MWRGGERKKECKKGRKEGKEEGKKRRNEWEEEEVDRQVGRKEGAVCREQMEGMLEQTETDRFLSAAYTCHTWWLQQVMM